MKIYKLFFLAVALFSCLTVQAKDLKTMFVSTPDTMVMYLNSSQREMLLSTAVAEKDTCSIILNLLDKHSWLEKCDSNLIVLHACDVRVMEYRMLMSAEGDSLLCLIDTYMGPEKESKVVLYDMDWKEKGRVELKDYVRPQELDSVEDETIGSYLPVLEMPLVSASFDEKDELAMVISQSMPLFNNEEKNKQNASKMQTKVKWNGKMFKECENI